MRPIIVLMLIAGHFDLLGQSDKILNINPDSLEFFYTKETTKKKTFESLGLDYDYFVNPGEDFNSTDLHSSKIPGCRLIVSVKAKNSVIIFYECGSYYGPLADCQIGITGSGEVERYTPIDRIRSKEELMTLIQNGEFKIKTVPTKK